MLILAHSGCGKVRRRYFGRLGGLGPSAHDSMLQPLHRALLSQHGPSFELPNSKDAISIRDQSIKIGGRDSQRRAGIHRLAQKPDSLGDSPSCGRRRVGAFAEFTPYIEG